VVHDHVHPGHPAAKDRRGQRRREQRRASHVEHIRGRGPQRPADHDEDGEGSGGSQYVDQAAPLVVRGSAQTDRHRDDAEQERQLEQPLEFDDDAAPRRWQEADGIPERSYQRQGRAGRDGGTLNQAPDEH
jgi:hypothetical protein